MNDISPAGIGHNSGATGPIPGIDHDKLRASLNAVQIEMNAGAEWRAKLIETEEDAAKVSDYLTRCRALKGKIETEGEEQRKPLNEALKAARAPYKEMLDKLDRQITAIREALQPYLVAKEARLKAEADAKAAAAAEEARRASDMHAQAMMAGDIDSEVEAEKRLRAAEKAAKAAARPVSAAVASHSGAGRASTLRRIHQVEIVSVPQVCGALFADEITRPALIEALTTIINSERRTRKGYLPKGATVTEKVITS